MFTCHSSPTRRAPKLHFLCYKREAQRGGVTCSGSHSQSLNQGVIGSSACYGAVGGRLAGCLTLLPLPSAPSSGDRAPGPALGQSLGLARGHPTSTWSNCTASRLSLFTWLSLYFYFTTTRPVCVIERSHSTDLQEKTDVSGDTGL